MELAEVSPEARRGERKPLLLWEVEEPPVGLTLKRTILKEPVGSKAAHFHCTHLSTYGGPTDLEVAQAIQQAQGLSGESTAIITQQRMDLEAVLAGRGGRGASYQ